MCDFRFNFLSSEDEKDGDPQGLPPLSDVPERPAKMLSVTTKDLARLATSSEATITSAEFCSSEVSICHIESAEAQAGIQVMDAGKDSDDEEESDCAKAIHQHSDLIPGVYEGGLKIWECSRDLVEYLHKSAVQFEGKRVLEIGCGAALPGLYALLMGAKAVDFQDYNEEVLLHVTIPNVAANMLKVMQLKQSRSMQHPRRSPRRSQQPAKSPVRLSDAAKAVAVGFLAGDWGKLQEMFTETFLHSVDLKYDIVLTSETIYRQATHSKLLDLLKCCLAPSGIVYLAAKSHYFGVGGSVRDFEKIVESDTSLACSVVVKETGQGVMREILELKWQNG